MTGLPPDFPDRRRVCAVCGHSLDYYGWDDGSPGLGWDHNLYDKDRTTIDHIAVPVLPGEVPGDPRCDFCMAGQVAYILPCKSFIVAPGHGSHGDWAACPECGMLIKAGQWNILVERVWTLSAYRDTVPKGVLTTGYSVLFADLRKHITGDLIPTTNHG